jgi:SAM-dependent methyltransferase
MQCHVYQREACESLRGGRILSVACKEDPSQLGRDFGAINLDQQDFDPQEQLSLYEIPNFVVGDACNLPFGAEEFDLVVLGEFLEHCPFDAAVTALREASRVIRPDGRIAVTVPLDGRPAEAQHAPEHLVTWAHGITSWHQTVWDESLFSALLGEVGLREVDRSWRELNYGFCTGFGVMLRKPGE